MEKKSQTMLTIFKQPIRDLHSQWCLPDKTIYYVAFCTFHDTLKVKRPVSGTKKCSVSFETDEQATLYYTGCYM